MSDRIKVGIVLYGLRGQISDVSPLFLATGGLCKND